MNAYGQLIQKVKKVDRIAALRLARQIPLLAKRGKLTFCSWSNNLKIDTLDSTFAWHETKEGDDYWYDVFRRCK